MHPRTSTYIDIHLPPSLPSKTSPKNSMLTRSFSGRLGQVPLNRIPHSRLPRLPHKLVRQRFTNRAAAPIRHTPRVAQANLRRLHRLPQHGQILNHKHPPLESRVQDRAHPGRNKGLAVFGVDATHLFDRLSWRCASESDRFRC